MGPVWRYGADCEPELLASAYRNSLELARAAGAKTLAFPAISTGVYGYPKDQAAEIAVTTVAAYLKEHPVFRQVIFACFSAESAAAHEAALAKIKGAKNPYSQVHDDMVSLENERKNGR